MTELILIFGTLSISILVSLSIGAFVFASRKS